MLSSFNFLLLELSKIVSFGVQKLMGKHVTRKIENIHVLHIVYSIAQKRNPVDFSKSSCKETMLPNMCCKKINIARLRVIGIFKI